MIRCCSAITSASRRCLTSAGTVSGILRAAYVPSRSEYANVNAPSKRSSSCARSVARNSSSVSSQKPISRSVVMAMPGHRAQLGVAARGTSRSRSRAACAPAPRPIRSAAAGARACRPSASPRSPRIDVVREIERVGRREAHALDAVDGGDRAQQLGEPDVLVAVRVDRLAEQLHLLDAGLDQRAHLAQDLARRRAPLAPARVGHHAEGAELVAAALDGDVADHAARARSRSSPS